VFARLHSLSAASRDTFWRSLKALGATRIVIALVLLAYFGAEPQQLSHALTVQICFVYLVAAVGLQALASRWRRHFMLQLMSQVACDLTCISLLYIVAGGIRSGLGIMYLFPLAGCAILAPLVLALFSASLATLFMLGHTIYQSISEGDAPVLQAGLYGIAWFALVLAVNRMAARLIGQEELAAQRGIEVGVQQAVNRLVIAHSADGIMVVGADGTIYMSNPAAQQMLGGPALVLEGATLQPLAGGAGPAAG